MICPPDGLNADLTIMLYRREVSGIKKARVTARDVAREAGVSPATVSMILNNYKNISFSEETKIRVLEVCDRLGYQTLGKSRIDAISGRVLLIACPSFQNPHYIKEINGVQQRAQELGYETIVFCTQRSEEVEANMVCVCRALHVAGVLLLYQPDNTAAYQLLCRENQIVQLYDKSDSADINMIELDNIKIGRLVAEHLIGLGHRYIAHISLPLVETQPSRFRRIEGIRGYMEEQGLDPDKYLRVSTIDSEGLQAPDNLEGYETGYLLASHLIDSEIPVTAFSATNDMLAYGVMDAIYERKKRVPQNYSICGCDNLPTSNYQRISLTSVEHFTAEKGRDAVDILVQKIQSKKPSGYKEPPVRITRIEYAPRLIVRKSSGRCTNTIY